MDLPFYAGLYPILIAVALTVIVSRTRLVARDERAIRSVAVAPRPLCARCDRLIGTTVAATAPAVRGEEQGTAPSIVDSCSRCAPGDNRIALDRAWYEQHREGGRPT